MLRYEPDQGSLEPGMPAVTQEAIQPRTSAQDTSNQPCRLQISSGLDFPESDLDQHIYHSLQGEWTGGPSGSIKHSAFTASLGSKFYKFPMNHFFSFTGFGSLPSRNTYRLRWDILKWPQTRLVMKQQSESSKSQQYQNSEVKGDCI